MTSREYDVTHFTWAHGSIVYETMSPDQSLPSGERINADASDVNGLPMDRILFPQGGNWDFYAYNDLWVNRNGKNIKIASPDAAQPLYLLNSSAANVFSVSPDGRAVVVLLPVDQVPDVWKSYDTSFTTFEKIDPKDPYLTSRFNYRRLTQYALVNLDSGMITSLDSPSGLVFGLAYANVAWTHDGKKVLLTNTFLPLGGVDESERLKRLHPCAAAIFDTISREINCVVFNKRYLMKGAFVSDGFFTQHDDEVVLNIVTASSYYQISEDRFYYSSGNWKLITRSPSTADTSANSSPSLFVIVKQNLNKPPALWATDPATRKMRKFWDPNPLLAAINLGETSVFSWKDKSGYTWTAGLVKPPDYVAGKRYPLVIQTHGFMQNEFMSDGQYTTAFAARPLASAGIIVLQMDYNRNHEVTGAEISDQVRGFESAISQLTSEGLIDSQAGGHHWL